MGLAAELKLRKELTCGKTEIEKGLRKQENNTRNMCDVLKGNNIRVTGLPEGEETREHT